jgi:polyribonucleotide nucleotidyltransferase
LDRAPHGGSDRPAPAERREPREHREAAAGEQQQQQALPLDAQGQANG